MRLTACFISEASRPCIQMCFAYEYALAFALIDLGLVAAEAA